MSFCTVKCMWVYRKTIRIMSRIISRITPNVLIYDIFSTFSNSWADAGNSLARAQVLMQFFFHPVSEKVEKYPSEPDHEPADLHRVFVAVLSERPHPTSRYRPSQVMGKNARVRSVRTNRERHSSSVWCSVKERSCSPVVGNGPFARATCCVAAWTKTNVAACTNVIIACSDDAKDVVVEAQ